MLTNVRSVKKNTKRSSNTLLHLVSFFYGTDINCHIQSNVEVTVKKTVNQLYNYSTVLGAAIKCKPYSEITVEIGTHLKTVKFTFNIFAVYVCMYVSH